MKRLAATLMTAIMVASTMVGCGLGKAPKSASYRCPDNVMFTIAFADSGDQARVEVVTLGRYDLEPLPMSNGTAFTDGRLTVRIDGKTATLDGLPGHAMITCNEVDE